MFCANVFKGRRRDGRLYQVRAILEARNFEFRLQLAVYVMQMGIISNNRFLAHTPRISRNCVYYAKYLIHRFCFSLYMHFLAKFKFDRTVNTEVIQVYIFHSRVFYCCAAFVTSTVLVFRLH